MTTDDGWSELQRRLAKQSERVVGTDAVTDVVPSRLFKWLDPDRMAAHGGDGRWPPPGHWLSVEGHITPCQRGLHVCRERDLPRWITDDLWTVEVDPAAECIMCDTKIVVSRARLVKHLDGWNRQTARLFAADCAERVAPVKPDERVLAAIVAARRHAFGLIDDATLQNAAVHAWGAAFYCRQEGLGGRDASRCAAWAADAHPIRAAWNAAAWNTGGQWASKRLLQYARRRVDLEAMRGEVS